ncbi:hypothetical protein G7085_13305 [Tessaracoccus sp. HDW20]|uniref:hypothetical protein n=1 Tax=Tessaracoccus coleopterorum TaxID=2714950 RepID=UPI0018D33F73|nr:hypothetical protein [Tessaracoccus coleopterorum]NHB85283.1 hypothetical protein [Tessaracoccus coleopterorum]
MIVGERHGDGCSSTGWPSRERPAAGAWAARSLRPASGGGSTTARWSWWVRWSDPTSSGASPLR